MVRGFGTEREEALHELRVEQAEELLGRGEFPAGSMGPKVEAAIRYVRETGRGALITDMERLASALRREAGTWIVP